MPKSNVSLRSWGPTFIIIAAILWGVDGILRRSLYSLHPAVIVFSEHLIGAIIIAPFTIKALKREKVSAKDWIVLLWISLLSGVAGTLLFTAALAQVYYISFSVVFLLQKLQPIFAISMAVIVLKEKITLKYLGWALLALAAAYFVTFNNGRVNLETGSGTVIAALLALGAAFAWGSSTAFSRLTLLHLSDTLTTGLRFFLTVPLALITVFIFKSSNQLVQIESSQLIRLITIALTTGMVALWIYYKGLRRTQVKVATILELMFPLTAIIIDLTYYHNVLALSQYLAAAILLFAMYRISLTNNTTDEISHQPNQGTRPRKTLGLSHS